ncbi:MAG: PD-(D/E)XK nuclease family protein [Elusimicrobiaceae bacterium]|nr:PD-(D/E)XK nuclease family protein [Elusimicrobiaceae bacterium]
MAKNLSFSYSKMGMYKECPQKYKFRYVHMLPEQPKYYFAFGSALHEVMEYIYDPKHATFPSQAQALAFFKKHWDSTSFDQKGYASMEKEALGFEEGCRILRAYYDKHAATFQHPLSVEMKSTLEMDGLNLISILDRIDYLGDGKIKILDYKTGKTVQREPDQLMMYQKVAESSPMVLQLVQTLEPSVKQVRVEQMSFYHLPTLQEMTFERSDDKSLYEFWQRVLGVADSIREGKFAPAPDENKCRWCDYRNICPVFTGKEYDGAAGLSAKIFPPSTAPQAAPKTDEEVLTEKVDRLGNLFQEEKKLRADVIALMEKLQFQQHFTTHFHAELARQKQLVFADKAKTIELLRRLHLLGKTLVPTQSTIAALLTDPTLSDEMKNELRALATEQENKELHITEAD